MRKIYIPELQTNIIYEMTTCKKEIEDVGVVQVYGINVYQEGGDNLYADENVCKIEDISSKYEEVAHLMNLLAENHVMPVHILDVVSDYVAVV